MLYSLLSAERPSLSYLSEMTSFLGEISCVLLTKLVNLLETPGTSMVRVNLFKIDSGYY